MTIHTVNKNTFQLIGDSNTMVASITYTNSAFARASLQTGESFLLSSIATGVWTTMLEKDRAKKTRTRMKVETGGIISVNLIFKRKKYLFKKSAGWKLRFSLVNKDGEELLTIIPSVNWEKESHDFVLQLNDDFENECDSFLILHAVHCANCSLSMMTGGAVPALVSI
jgi:hypothetical protein